MYSSIGTGQLPRPPAQWQRSREAASRLPRGPHGQLSALVCSNLLIISSSESQSPCSKVSAVYASCSHSPPAPPLSSAASCAHSHICLSLQRLVSLSLCDFLWRVLFHCYPESVSHVPNIHRGTGFTFLVSSIRPASSGRAPWPCSSPRPSMLDKLLSLLPHVSNVMSYATKAILQSL